MFPVTFPTFSSNSATAVCLHLKNTFFNVYGYNLLVSFACLPDWIWNTDYFFFCLTLSFLFSLSDRLYTISGSLRDPLPHKEAPIEIWDPVTLLCWMCLLPPFPSAWPLPSCDCAPPHLGRWCFLTVQPHVWNHPGDTLKSQRLSLAPRVVFSAVKRVRAHCCSPVSPTHPLAHATDCCCTT